MWHIEIRDNEKGEYPGHIRASFLSRLPSLDKLVRTDNFSIMTRVKSPVKDGVMALCKACRRREDLAKLVGRQKQLRSTYGPNVIAFPVQV